MKPQQRTPKQKRPVSNYSIGEIFYICLSRWYWFAISLTIALTYALYDIATTPNVYTRYSEILIKSKQRGSSIDEQMENFANMGTFRPSLNAYNEIYTFKAPETIVEAVRRLRLNMEYQSEGIFHLNTLYGESLPVKVTLCDIGIDEPAALSIDITPEGEFTMHGFKGRNIEKQSPVKGSFGNDTVTIASTPLGDIILERNMQCHFKEKMTVLVKQIGLQNAAALYGSKVSYILENEDSEIITMSISDLSIERADDILKTLVEVYNDNWVKDKNRAAAGTEKFINERLKYISAELDTVDNSISSFKGENLLPDLNSAISTYMAKNKETRKKKENVMDELAYAHSLLDEIREKSKETGLLAMSAGLSNSNINSQISAYNNKMMERNIKAGNSSGNSPVIKEADMEIASMREALLSSIETHIRILNTQIAALDKEIEATEKEIAKNPDHTTFLASAEREQSVKEKLYLFLLQKREENQLSQAFTAYKTRIITPPTGSLIPTAPLKNRILGTALAIGLLIPTVILVLKEVSNTKVRGRKDLDGLTVPVIGEIPLIKSYDDDEEEEKGRKGSKKKKEKITVAVRDGSRNIINEAFRVLRTNIEFMTRDKSSNIIIYSSFNPGSGKTFCILNTAISLAIKGEKVLLIDGDMRHASLSNYVQSPDTGLSNYLAKDKNSAKEVTIVDEKYSNLHIIPVGTIPPNPTELLESDRFEKLINEVKEQYTYILIDCPPVDIVADTHIIEKFAHSTFFLVRVGLLERSMLNEIEDIYTENKIKNLAIIVNAVDTEGSKYGYRYGYRYGYHYGGYAYGTTKKKKK